MNTIIIPAYEPTDELFILTEALLKRCDANILVVDDGSGRDYEMNMLLDWTRDRRCIREVTIETVYHDASNSCSHFHTLYDSFRIYKQILRRATSLLFGVSSFSSFLLDYIIFLTLVQAFNSIGAVWGVIVSNVLARVVSAVFNYNLNRFIVFRSHESSRQTGLAYAALALGILIGNSAILSLLTDVLGLLPALAKILTKLTLFISSYAVQKYLIFNSFGHTKEKRKYL